MASLLVCVAGGSASGKSTVVEEIVKRAGLNDVRIIKHDDYYKDALEDSLEAKQAVNYDHPESLDNDLLVDHLTTLLSGQSIEKPIYDFVDSKRSGNYETILPSTVILIEGILILDDPRIRALSSLSIYVELDDDTRFIRRMLRDLKERHRSLEHIVKQYQTTVKPMFHQFVRPTKRYADIIIPNDSKHAIAVDLIVAKIKQFLYENA